VSLWSARESVECAIGVPAALHWAVAVLLRDACWRSVSGSRFVKAHFGTVAAVCKLELHVSIMVAYLHLVQLVLHSSDCPWLLN